MRFCTTQSALRFVAITFVSIILASCGQGDGPKSIKDPEAVSLSLPVKNGFEDPGAVTITDFGGGAAAIVDNPVKSPAARVQARKNAVATNSSAKVGQMKKFAGETYGGATITLPDTLAFADSKVLTILVWASRRVDLTFKLEGPTDADDREVIATHRGFSRWEELVLDFSGKNPPDTNTITLIFDNGTMGDAAGNPSRWTFYFDNLAGGSGASGGTGGGSGGGGELITNGTFETGNTTGWDFDPTANGTFVATTSQSTGPGSNSGNLKASGAGSFPTIKQSNLAIGTVTPNQAVTISFDLCGSQAGIGGVFFAQFFSEPEIGSALPSDLQFIGGGAPLTPTETWTQYTLTTLTAGNVDGGVSLLFKADCGGNADCEVNAYIDNVSVTLGSDSGNVSGAGGACPKDTGGGGGGGGGPAAGARDPVYATSDTVTIPSTISDWGSGTGIVADYSGDATYNPSIQLTSGTGWGDVSAVAFTAIEAGKILQYTNLEFKIKTTDYSTIQIKIPGATTEQPQYTIADGTPLADGWVQMSIALSDFGTIPAAINEFALLEFGAGTMLITDVVFTGDSAGGGGGGGGTPGVELAVNGDFETGDFGGWAQYPSAQTTQTIGVDPTTASNVARLFIPAVAGGVNNVLKQERLYDGGGVFSSGDIVQISFDYRGEPGEGILFAKSICETAAGTCGDKLHNSGAPFTPMASWTTYTDTFTLGAGVSAYTLEFAAVCGGTGTCVADYFIDNVSITIQ